MLWINGKMTDLTKKDAIHKLVDAKCFLERYSNPHDKWTEAINIGIEAIEIVMDQEEQEPTTKNDLGVDCISRAEAIKCLECDFDITGKENMKTVVNYINSAHDKIVNLPRVKQEPETGHWINRGKQGEVLPFYMRYECSMCGETADKSNYCPNCGAKMAESEG